MKATTRSLPRKRTKSPTELIAVTRIAFDVRSLNARDPPGKIKGVGTTIFFFHPLNLAILNVFLQVMMVHTYRLLGWLLTPKFDIH